MWLIRIGSRTPASALCRKQQQSCPMVWPMALRPCFAGDSTWKQLRSLWLQLWSKIVGKTTHSGCQTLSKCFQFKHVWLIEIGLVYLIFHNFDTKQSTSICNTPSFASVTPFHPSMNINDDYLGTLFTKQTLQTLKQLQPSHYVHLHLTQRWSSPLTEPIDARQCSGANDPLTSLWRKKVPHFTEVLSGTSHRKKRLRKSFIYHFHQFNNLKSLFGCLTRCQFFLQYLQNLQYQDPVKKKQY